MNIVLQSFPCTQEHVVNLLIISSGCVTCYPIPHLFYQTSAMLAVLMNASVNICVAIFFNS